jgi:hypothetical protein
MHQIETCNYVIILKNKVPLHIHKLKLIYPVFFLCSSLCDGIFKGRSDAQPQGSSSKAL